MIQHVVMFKILPELLDKKDEVKAAIKTKLEALPSKIAQIKSFEVGANIKESDRSYDLVLVSSFDSLATLQEYAVHPEHLEVVKYIKETCGSISAVDYQA